MSNLKDRLLSYDSDVVPIKILTSMSRYTCTTRSDSTGRQSIVDVQPRDYQGLV